MPRPRKPWSKTVEASGVAVRLYERGGAIYREARLGGGAKDSKSLHTSDRAHTVQLAEALARDVANFKHAGRVGPLTYGELAARYQAARLPLLSPARQRAVAGQLALLGRHFANALPVADLSQHRVDAYGSSGARGTRSGASGRASGGTCPRQT